ncbi:MAG: nitroreductase family protein, partial [Acidimicrobiia bacterium]
MPPPGDDDRLAVVEAIAHSRRSNLRMDPERPVADDLVDRLIAMAGTAPNHRRTFPWRFRVLTGEARAALGEALASHLVTAGDPPEKIAKARAKYLRAPTIVVAASRAGDSAVAGALAPGRLEPPRERPAVIGRSAGHGDEAVHQIVGHGSFRVH